MAHGYFCVLFTENMDELQLVSNCVSSEKKSQNMSSFEMDILLVDL